MSTNVLIYQDHEKSKALMFLAKKCKAFMFHVLISSSFKAFMFLNRHVLIIKNLCSCEYMIIIIVLAKTTMIILTFFNAKSAKNTNNQNATHVGLEIGQAFKRYFCFCSTANEKKTTDPFFSDDLLDYILLFKIYNFSCAYKKKSVLRFCVPGVVAILVNALHYYFLNKNMNFWSKTFVKNMK